MAVACFPAEKSCWFRKNVFLFRRGLKGGRVGVEGWEVGMARVETDMVELNFTGGERAG